MANRVCVRARVHVCVLPGGKKQDFKGRQQKTNSSPHFSPAPGTGCAL